MAAGRGGGGVFLQCPAHRRSHTFACSFPQGTAGGDS